MTRAFFFLLALMISPCVAKDMDFTLQEKDLRPNFDLRQWIFADGDIVPGTAGRFIRFVKLHPQLMRDATVILNSPGGSPLEGMQLGDAIRDLHYRTAVGVAGTEPMKLLPGQCMSACIYPFLGGEYRYLNDGSAIGLHQFRFAGEVGGVAAAEISQELSGRIVSFIKRSRADPSLFALMTQTPPDSVHLVPLEDLAKLKVVTGDIYSEEWNFEVHGEISYLKAEQISWRGQNKIMLFCPRNNKNKRFLMMMILSEVPDREMIINSAKNIIMIIDGKGRPVPPKAVVEPPQIAGGSYLQWTIAVTPEIATALRMADTIGSGVSPGPPEVFAGVAGINIGDGRQKLLRILNDCR